MKSAIGQRLLLAAGNAMEEAVLVAPFVKVNALRRILDRIPTSTTVQVVARWIPGEILAGVCDLEIYDLIVSRQNAELFVHPLLHAKWYRFDESVYFGSANLTSKAMGWAFPANIETLELANEQAQNIRELECHLLATATKVDASYRDELAKQIELLRELTPVHESFFQAHVPTRSSFWLPACRDPRRLWLVYSDPDEARKRTVESAYEAAQKDLAALGIPPGLTSSKFRETIVATLDELSIVATVAHRALKGIKDKDAIILIADYSKLGPENCDVADQWEVLREWLLEFFPGIYRRETHPDVFRIAKVLE